MDPHPERLAARPLALPSVYSGDTVVEAFAAAIGEALAPTEERIESLDAVLDPWRAPPAFLDWLIRITGARVEPGWSENQRRKAVDLAPRLAAHRGTPYGLLLEAKELHGWDRLVVDDPGGVFTDGDRPPRAGRMLTVTLTAGRDEDRPALEHRLTRLVRAHCPAHLPFKVAVISDQGARREARRSEGAGPAASAPATPDERPQQG
ncbi:phage tail protein [Streptomyces sp. URMC 124]|uniref:phage tail protein n=1 Tax=Streptomyces sp. URMC 124 TaxID=3423405 RepID=UPI003F1D92A5